MPLKNYVSTREDLMRSFIANNSRVGLLIRLGYGQGLHSFNLVSGNLMSFCGSFKLASGGLLEELLLFL